MVVVGGWLLAESIGGGSSLTGETLHVAQGGNGLTCCMSAPLRAPFFESDLSTLVSGTLQCCPFAFAVVG